MKLTPQILVFYLGTWCTIKNCNAAMLANGYHDGVWALDFQLMYYVACKMCDVQLHLRRLSDKTEEEERENKSLMFMGTDGVHTIGIYQVTPKSFVYLLSRSFDLFGLIDAGEAIDEKTITQQ